MNKLLSCRFNMDTNRVEARFEDSIPLAINCITVEDVTRELEKRHVIDHKVKQERMQREAHGRLQKVQRTLPLYFV